MINDPANSVLEQLKREELTVSRMKPIELSALVGQVSSYWKLAKLISREQKNSNVDEN